MNENNTDSSVNPYSAPAADLDVPRAGADAGDLRFSGTRKCSIGSGPRWFMESWAFFRASPVAWIVAIIIFFVLSIAVQLVPLIGTLIMMAITPALIAGFMIGCAAQHNDEPFEIQHMFAGFSDGKFVKYLLLALLQLVAVLLLVAVIAGVVALTVGLAVFDESSTAAVSPVLAIIAGVVTLVLMVPLFAIYYFSPALVALGDLEVLASIKESLVGCFRNFIPLVLYAIIVTLAMIIAVIPLGLGLLVVFPMAIASMFIAYREIYTGAG